MKNGFRNIVDVIGTREEINDLLKLLEDGEKYNFTLAIPEPCPNNRFKNKSDLRKQAWKKSHWGSESVEACGIYHFSEDSAQFVFRSEGTPVLKLLVELSKKFPKLEFYHYFENANAKTDIT